MISFVFYLLPFFEVIFFFYLVKIIAISDGIDKSQSRIKEITKTLFFFIAVITAYYLGPGITGLKGQYILGDIYQPSTFAVFFFTKYLLFFKRKTFFLTFIFLLIPAIFHPSSMLISVVLGIFYILKTFSDHPKTVLVYTFLGGSIFSIIFYDIYMISLSSQEEKKIAYEILSTFRIPQHSDPNTFRLKDIVNSIFLILGIFYCKNKVLRFILISGSIVIFLSLIILSLLNFYSLNLLFPWRISVVLVPLAYLIICNKIYSLVFESNQINFFYFVARFVENNLMKFLTFAIFLFIGLSAAINSSNFHIKDEFVLDLRKRDNQNTDILVPIDFTNIRLNTPVSIFVDFKSHPLNPREIIEWKRRIDLAQSFYSSSSAEEAIFLLEEISRTSNTNHALIKDDKVIYFSKCEFENIGDYFLFNFRECLF